MKRILGVSLLTLGIAGFAMAGQDGNSQGQDGNSQGQDGNSQGQDWNNSGYTAGTHLAPEINPSQAISALLLLSGGILVIRRKK
jgi:hypothetical protein